MFTDSEAKFEVKGLAGISAIKCLSRQQMLEKMVSQLWIDKCKGISEVLAAMHETSQYSIETDSAGLSFSCKPRTYFSCTCCGISYLSPKATKKKEVSKTKCLRNNHKNKTGSISSCCI